MGSGLRFSVIDDDMMKMLPKNLDSRIAWDMVQEEFGSTEIIFIAFGKKGQTVFHPNAFAALWDISEKLDALLEVKEVMSISTATRMDNYDGFMEIDDLQPHRNLTENDIQGIKAYLDKNPNIKDKLKNISNKISYKHGDGKLGWLDAGPFDAIYIDCCVKNEPKYLYSNLTQDEGVLITAKTYDNGQYYCSSLPHNGKGLVKSNYEINRGFLL